MLIFPLSQCVIICAISLPFMKCVVINGWKYACEKLTYQKYNVLQVNSNKKKYFHISCYYQLLLLKISIYEFTTKLVANITSRLLISRSVTALIVHLMPVKQVSPHQMEVDAEAVIFIPTHYTLLKVINW